MRKDMAKVLVERPRGGPRLRLKRRKQHQGVCRRPDDTVRREPMSRGRGSRSPSEYLTPLLRFLDRQVGRPWDAVHSEICAQLRPSNTVQQHVLVHLAQFVEQHVWREDGVLMQMASGRPRRLDEVGPGASFYVCPRSGLLCRRPPRREPARAPSPDADVRRLGPWLQLRRIRGVWYAFRLAPVPADPAAWPALRDGYFSRPLSQLVCAGGDPLARAHGRCGIYAAGKRQLSKRELRRLLAPADRRR